MSIIMFEGFNRQNDFDPALWVLSNTTLGNDGNYAVWGGGTVRGSLALLLYPPTDPENWSANSAVFAKATFPGPAQPANGAETVCVGFCSSGSLYTDVFDADIRYFGIGAAGGSEICSIELKGADSAEPGSQNVTRLTLRFKQNGNTVAEFNIPDTALPIYASGDGLRKIGGAAYLNSGAAYFEFVFNFANNTVAVFFNGTQLQTPAGATTAPLTLSSIQSWTFYAPKYLSASYDDFYVTTGQRLGYKTRVVSPTAVSFIPRQILGGGADAFPSAWENHAAPASVNVNDGDNTTIYTATPGAVTHYTFPVELNETDAVLAVRLSAVARTDGQGASVISFQHKYRQYDPAAEPPIEDAVDLGTFQLTAAYYNRFYTEFMTSKPIGPGLLWQPSDFSNNEDVLLGRKGFGVKYSLPAPPE